MVGRVKRDYGNFLQLKPHLLKNDNNYEAYANGSLKFPINFVWHRFAYFNIYVCTSLQTCVVFQSHYPINCKLRTSSFQLFKFLYNKIFMSFFCYFGGSILGCEQMKTVLVIIIKGIVFFCLCLFFPLSKERPHYTIEIVSIILPNKTVLDLLIFLHFPTKVKNRILRVEGAVQLIH